MKFLAALTLAASMTSAFAMEEFGGVNFDSSVDQKQVSIIKKDLTYVYQNPVTTMDNEFLTMAGLSTGDGKNLHNWLLNRVRYIVGEGFQLDKSVKWRPKLFFKYPNTPLPEAIAADSIQEVKTVMSNIGGAIYLIGKKSDILFGVALDSDTVTVKSPRTGVLQVGEGLFFEGFLINKQNPEASSNSISRLGTLFHEARHSDGNGLGTGFLHKICPAGHPYANYAACEMVGNGPYTLGALSERHLLQNCTDCSLEEKMGLSAAIADSLNRVFDPAKAAKRTSLLSEIQSLKDVRSMYYSISWPEMMREKVNSELQRIEARIAEIEKELENFSLKPDTTPAYYDAAPEGKFDELSLEKTSKLMNKSLKK